MELILKEVEEHALEFTGERITRCKDCSFCILDRNMRNKCAFFNAPVKDTDFCSKAKRYDR